jgi:hypothetical protein
VNGQHRRQDTYEVRDLAERLLLDELRCLVATFGEIDRDELERSVRLLHDDHHPLAAGGVGRAVELEDHDEECGECRW